MEKNGFELLKEDHRNIARLFSRLENSTNKEKDDQKRAFRLLRDVILFHSTVEEKILYSIAKAREEMREFVDESCVYHRLIGQLLEDLDDMSAGTDEWLSALAELNEYLSKHANRDEVIFFPLLERLLSNAEFADLQEAICENYEI